MHEAIFSNVLEKVAILKVVLVKRKEDERAGEVIVYRARLLSSLARRKLGAGCPAPNFRRAREVV